MSKTKARAQSADIPSTPRGAGQYRLVASTSQAPKTADLADPHSVKNAFLRRQNAPCASHRDLPGIDAPLKAATTFTKSPYIAG
jgi:hypothetical protein